MSNNDKLSLEQVAEILQMKPVTIKRYVREGLLDGTEEKGVFTFDPDKVNRFRELQSKVR